MSQNSRNYSITDILVREFERFKNNYPLPLHVIRTVHSIIDCRTPVFGGHMFECPDEHFSLILFNSCKKRNCPTCQHAEMEYWAHVQKERILNTGHYHIVFKHPDFLHREFLSNYSEYANLLFDAAGDTLKELSGNRIKPGIILILHTHGRNNEIHPHIHCAITDGGMNERGEYERFDESLMSSENISRIFQKQYLRKLRKRLKNGRIAHETESQEFTSMISKKGMSVFVSNRYDRGEWLISYFARNSRGGSIRNNQILHIDEEKIRYRYLDAGKSQVETEMNIDTFIQRFLYHIPPDRFNTIRYYGLYSTGCVEDYQKIRKLLNQKVYTKPERKGVGEKETMVCPVCGKSLIHREIFSRNSIPFLLLKKLKFNPEAIRSLYWMNPDKIRGLKYHWIEPPTSNSETVANRIA